MVRRVSDEQLAERSSRAFALHEVHTALQGPGGSADETLDLMRDLVTERALSAKLAEALEEIAESPHCSYEWNKDPGKAGSYNTGVVDGHRCAAATARAALAAYREAK